MENRDIQLKNKIMRRVYSAWILKKILSMDFALALVFSILFAEFLREVSVISVFNNLPNGISSVTSYILMAFNNTETTVRVYLVSMSLIFGWIVGERAARPVFNLSLIRSRF